MSQSIFEEMIATRRALHQRPEEGWTEFETTYLVVNRLKALGFKKVLVGHEIIDPDWVMGRNPDLIKREIASTI